MEKFPIEIKESDLCKIDGKVYEIVRISDEMAEDIPEFYRYRGMLAFDYLNCDDCFYNYVNTVDEYCEEITAVYRLVGKDYICIFERELGYGNT